MAAAIWNKDDHSMADLPVEILNDIFKYLTGTQLIQLRKVCTSFNNLINDSPLLTAQIAFKMIPVDEKSCFIEGAKILAETNWDTDALSIYRIYIKKENVAEFRKGRVDWKHLRMYNCYFDAAETMVEFLSIVAGTLETLVLDQVIVSHWLRSSPPHTITFPVLKVLRSTNFQIDFVCNAVTELELKSPRYVEYLYPAKLLKTNQIEVLTLTYKHIDFNFETDTMFQRALTFIKKLVINCNFSLVPIDRRTTENFQRFMRLQTNIEEVNIEVYYEWETFSLFLNTILGNMVSVQKFTLRERHEPIYPVIDRFPQNLTITELCFERRMTNNSKIIFHRIVEACPRINSLKVFNFEQAMLAEFFFNLRNLKTIEAKTFALGDKPPFHTLLWLDKIKCYRFSMVDKPELPYLPFDVQKEIVLNHLRGERYLQRREELLRRNGIQ